jgi:quercetin dioxygenase-like cupin family protein
MFSPMEAWDVSSLDVQPHQPEVLATNDEGRVIAIQLPAGEMLQEHQVHERAWLVVLSGEVELVGPDGSTTEGGAGLLAVWEPAERHEVRAKADARLLLVLSPWPGVGHPSQRKSDG